MPLIRTTFRDIRKVRWDRRNKVWLDHAGRKMEWHPGDRIEAKWVFIWHCCQSNQKFIRRWGWRQWGH